jgi:pyrimidine operon attenuation protein/uracil phosphoribosyltransferase
VERGAGIPACQDHYETPLAGPTAPSQNHLQTSRFPALPPHLRPPQPGFVAKHQTIGADEIRTAIQRLAEAISERHRDRQPILLLGIANGGIELARRLHTALDSLDNPISSRAGTVDISFHRDDIGRHPIPKEFSPTHIPADVNGANVVLVDDVLFSGRTVKAALDELFDHGRPTKVELAVLVDRGGRRMPLAADYVGLDLFTPGTEKVVVTLDPKNPKLDSVRIEPADSAAKTAAL